MKAILLSIKPKWVAKILNKTKTIEVRKCFPKDYKGWVYIYCMKLIIKTVPSGTTKSTILNGKVVARFYCDNVEEIKYRFGYYDMGEWTESYILEKSCLSAEELDDYLQASKDYDETKVSGVYGYAIHISNLEIFDKPRELSEFKQPRNSYGKVNFKATDYYLTEVSKALQNMCYIEEV